MHPLSVDHNVGAMAATAGVVANFILGASSLYWRALGGIPHQTLLCYRILISLITLTVILTAKACLRSLIGSVSLRLFIIHALAAILVVINWGTFIWASICGHVLESALGYLLAPFVAIAVGILILGDRTGLPRIVALLIIVGAVGYLLRSSGELTHWVYLTIGATWGGYACCKNWTTLDSFSGIFVETIILAALIPFLLFIPSVTLSLPNTTTNAQFVLLTLCGFVSVIPLILFSFAASRLPLSVMGFLQFVLPSTQLIVALEIYRQSASNTTLICFLVIWLSLALLVVEPLFMTRTVKHMRT